MGSVTTIFTVTHLVQGKVAKTVSDPSHIILCRLEDLNFCVRGTPPPRGPGKRAKEEEEEDHVSVLASVKGLLSLVGDSENAARLQ